VAGQAQIKIAAPSKTSAAAGAGQDNGNHIHQQ
jgi:hypothetical protein